MADRLKAQHTHCAKGHLITKPFGQRVCLVCRQEYQRNYRTLRRREAGVPLLRYTDRGTCKNGHILRDVGVLSFRASDRRSGSRKICRACSRETVHNRNANKRGLFVEYVDPMKLYLRDGAICGICNLPVHANQFHVDHIIPLAKGGEHSYQNTQVAHPSCNHRKSSSVDYLLTVQAS